MKLRDILVKFASDVWQAELEHKGYDITTPEQAIKQWVEKEIIGEDIHIHTVDAELNKRREGGNNLRALQRSRLRKEKGDG